MGNETSSVSSNQGENKGIAKAIEPISDGKSDESCYVIVETDISTTAASILPDEKTVIETKTSTKNELVDQSNYVVVNSHTAWLTDYIFRTEVFAKKSLPFQGITADIKCSGVLLTWSLLFRLPVKEAWESMRSCLKPLGNPSDPKSRLPSIASSSAAVFDSFVTIEPLSYRFYSEGESLYGEAFSSPTSDDGKVYCVLTQMLAMSKRPKYDDPNEMKEYRKSNNWKGDFRRPVWALEVRNVRGPEDLQEVLLILNKYSTILYIAESVHFYIANGCTAVRFDPLPPEATWVSFELIKLRLSQAKKQITDELTLKKSTVE